MKNTQNISMPWLQLVPSLREGMHEKILEKIVLLREAGKKIFPVQEHIFSALKHTLPHDVRVIILGQDPYHNTIHGIPKAHGLAFSVQEHMPAPPSLKNIFKEIQTDIYKDMLMPCTSPCLVRWAKQGVLLLNTVLSVEEGAPQSHVRLGWQEITQDILHALSCGKHPLAILLWGKPAQKYTPLFFCTAPSCIAGGAPFSAFCGTWLLGL